jgi:hypothetical protein
MEGAAIRDSLLTPFLSGPPGIEWIRVEFYRWGTAMGRKMGFRRVALAGLVLTAVAAPVRAEGLDRMSFDFETLKQRFERQDAERQADGLVLQRLRDPTGQAQGRLSLGGDVTHRDPYEGTAAAVNFRGRSDEELGGSILNLRVSF